MEPFSLYIHIPFCSKICPYCDFTTYAVKNVPEKAYCEALREELKLYATHQNFVGRKVRTIFWGGGTPSLISPSFVHSIHETTKSLFGFEKNDIEITLEANPGKLSRERLQGYKQAGVNRLSLGAQSMQPRILKLLGRDHVPGDIIKAVELSRNVGMNNINLDLIFSVPGHTTSELLLDIKEYTKLSPAHISAYNLTIEKGTPFFQAVANNVFHPPSDETGRELYELLLNELPTRGYKQYEVSNFSKPNMHCKHNLHYWRRDDYLGIGVGAHSFVTSHDKIQYRYANTASQKEYREKLRIGALPKAWEEVITENESRSESIMLGLRLNEGVEERVFYAGLSTEKSRAVREKIDHLKALGLATSENDRIILTKAGLSTADSIAAELISEA